MRRSLVPPVLARAGRKRSEEDRSPRPYVAVCQVANCREPARNGPDLSTLCTLALSKKQPQKLVEELGVASPTEATEQYDEEPEPLPEPAQTYRAKTSFGRHFDEIAASVKATCVDDGQEQSSPFCAPAIVEYMLRKLMPLAPLWSQMLSEQVTSNAAVEAYMGVIKGKLLRGRTRLHTCEFIRMLMNDTSARVKGDMVPKRPVPRGKKRREMASRPPQEDKKKYTKEDSPMKNPEKQEEMWAKRNPKASGPSWYAWTRPPTCLQEMSGEPEEKRATQLEIKFGNQPEPQIPNPLEFQDQTESQNEDLFEVQFEDPTEP